MVGGEHFVDEPHPLDETILFQLLVVLVEKRLGFGEGPVAVFRVTGVKDAHAHAGQSHRCSLSVSSAAEGDPEEKILKCAFKIL